MQIDISKIFILDSEPTNKVQNRFWFNPTTNILSRCDGINWNPISLDKLSSDKVEIIDNGTSTSLTNFLSGKLSIIGEALDELESNKQNTLYHYNESGDGAVQITSSNDTGIVIGNETNHIDVYGNVNQLLAINSPVIQLNGGVTGSAIDTEVTSIDTKVPTSKAVKDYVIGYVTKLAQLPYQTPLTGKFTSTGANTPEKLISDLTQYADFPGRILINCSTNTNKILVKEALTSAEAQVDPFPVYIDQVISIPFANIADVWFITESAGDSFNYIVTFGQEPDTNA